MATVIKNPKIKPAEVFNRVQIDNFLFTQTRPDEVNARITRSCKIQGSTYSQDDETKKLTMSNDGLSCSISDIDSVVIDRYCRDYQKTLADVPMDLYTARANMLAKYEAGELNDLDLMAAFELVIGRLLELSGVVEIERIE